MWTGQVGKDMKINRGLIAIAAVLALAVAVGCTRARTDAQVIGEVVTKINSDPKISEKHVSVMSANGVVTLTGSAATEEERAQVANDAAQVEGVKTVVNNLLIAGPPSLQASALPPAADEQPEAKPAARPEPAKKPSAYRAAHNAALKKSASSQSDLPIVSSGPAVSNTAAPLPVSNTMASSTPSYTPPPPPPAPTPVTIDSGTPLNIRLVDAIDTGRNKAGDSFRATLDSPISVGDKVVIPEGADVVGHIVELKDAGKFTGKPELALELTSLSVNGRKYTIHTNQYSHAGKSRGTDTAKKVGAGAAIGAIIGGIAGGGKGAAIGAAAGGGLGGGVQAAGKAEQVRLESEALLSFRLESPVTVMPVGHLQRGRSNDYSGSNYPDNNNYTSHNRNNNYSQPLPGSNGPLPGSNASPNSSNNDNDVVDYSDGSSSNNNNNNSNSNSTDSNRPVLKRRPNSSD